MIERKPAVAGLFYPKDPEELRKTVEELISQGADRKRKVFGVISPHAGYIYSGKIAGKVFSEIEIPEKVVVLCPNHTGYGVRVSLFPKGKWLFPGFEVRISEEMNEFLSKYKVFEKDTGAHLREHSAEVIIPFLYFKNKNVEISVICIRTIDFTVLKEIGECLYELKKEFKDEILFVASSDMNHYEPDDISREKDKIAIDRIVNIDAEGLVEVVLEKNITMCGIAPTTSLLVSAKLFGINKAELVAYGNSGDVSGDYSSVVGYAGIVIPNTPIRKSNSKSEN